MLNLELNHQDFKVVKSVKTEIIPAVDLLRVLGNKIDCTYNVRNYNPKAPAYRAMMQTLKSAPESFNLGNNGVTVINKKYVVNGGHTCNAILNSKNNNIDVTKVKVKVEFIQIDESNNEVFSTVAKKISHSHNHMLQTSAVSRVALRDGWEPFIIVLGEETARLYEFKSETSVKFEYKPALLLALIKGLRCNSRQRCYAGPGSLVQEYNRNPEPILEHLGYLPLGLWLFSSIALYIGTHKSTNTTGIRTKQNVLPSGVLAKVEVSHGYIWPIYCSFGQLIKDYTPAGAEERVKEIFQIVMEATLPIVFDSKFRKENKDPNFIGRSKELYQRVLIAVAATVHAIDKEQPQLRAVKDD